MKILCVIDHFGSGGAQRQIVALACGLKKRGHSVEMFIYFPRYDFFRSRIDECQIPVHECKKGMGFSFGVLRKLSSLMRNGKFDIVLSYLNSPNIYVELASIISRGPKIIVSERTSHLNDKNLIGAYFRRLMHIFSNHIVANSRAHANWLKKKRLLKGKVSYIYNGLDLDTFSPGPPIFGARDGLRLLSIGRVGPQKNIIRLIASLKILQDENGHIPEISWVGKRDTSPAGQLYCERVDKLLEDLPVIRKHWHWLGEQSDIPKLLRHHHALIHPALYEGLPNVVCEALAVGKPVLVSAVCDNPLLVADSERGFLFDPKNPKSIASSIEKLINLNTEDLQSYSHNAREYAKNNLGLAKMVLAYEALFIRLIKSRDGINRVGIHRHDGSPLGTRKVVKKPKFYHTNK